MGPGQYGEEVGQSLICDSTFPMVLRAIVVGVVIFLDRLQIILEIIENDNNGHLPEEIVLQNPDPRILVFNGAGISKHVQDAQVAGIGTLFK